MKNSTRYIMQLCKSLVDEGQTPTLAKIRNRANRPLAIPEVIDVVRRWKQEPEAFDELAEPTEAADASPPEESDLAQRVTVLEQQVAMLSQQIANMQQR